VILFVIKELITKCSTFIFKKLEVVASASLQVRVCIVPTKMSKGFMGPRVLDRTCSIGNLTRSSYSRNPSLR